MRKYVLTILLLLCPGAWARLPHRLHAGVVQYSRCDIGEWRYRFSVTILRPRGQPRTIVHHHDADLMLNTYFAIHTKHFQLELPIRTRKMNVLYKREFVNMAEPL